MVTASVEKPSVLFVCVHNAGRSQMAAAYLQELSGGRVTVRSAGSDRRPAQSGRGGVWRRRDRPEHLHTEGAHHRGGQGLRRGHHHGCGDTCPIFPGKRYEDWELEDPAGKDLEVVRGIRDDIKGRVAALLTELLPN